MKVTCGSCFKALRVEDWLADNVARCPKCNEVIRLPPAGSPEGANAVVLTVEEAADLLRRRAEAGQIPTVPGGASAAPATPKKPGQPKTEPLPAFLRQAAGSVHEEPDHQKTRPLPRPTGRPSPVMQPGAAGLGAGDSRAGVGPGAAGAGRAAAGDSRLPATLPDSFDQPETASGGSRAGLITPLVPAAFILGLLVGAVGGWLIGQSRQAVSPPPAVGPTSELPAAGPPPTSPGPKPPNQVNTQVSTSSPQTPAVARERPAAPATTQPTVRQFAWDMAASANPLAVIDDAKVSCVRRVGGITDDYPVSNFYYPAPANQIYLDLTFSLTWVGKRPVTFRLGGPDAHCGLVCQDGRIIEPLGEPRTAVGGDAASPVANPDTAVTLDKSNIKAQIRVIFLAPQKLPPTRLVLAGCEPVDLPVWALEDADPTGKRSIDDKWESIPIQGFAQSYGEDHKILAALAGTPNKLLIERQPNSTYRLSVDKVAVSGVLTRTMTPGYLDATLTMGETQAKAVVRVFDGGRQLLFYFAPGKFMQCGYRRHEQNFFGL